MGFAGVRHSCVDPLFQKLSPHSAIRTGRCDIGMSAHMSAQMSPELSADRVQRLLPMQTNDVGPNEGSMSQEWFIYLILLEEGGVPPRAARAEARKPTPPPPPPRLPEVAKPTPPPPPGGQEQINRDVGPRPRPTT